MITTKSFLHRNGLLVGIMAGAILGAAAFAVFGPSVAAVSWIGDLVVKLLKLVVLPLVATSLVSALARLREHGGLARLGFRMIAYLVSTTLLAAVAGFGVAETLCRWLPSRPLFSGDSSAGSAPVRFSFLSGGLLPVLLLSLLAGLLLALLGNRARRFRNIFDNLNAVMLTLVRALMWVLPAGVFGLVASMLARTVSLRADAAWLGRYLVAVLGGILLHGFVVIPLLMAWLARRNAYRYLFALAPAVLMGFATASSAGTLPVTLDCATRRGRVRPAIAAFVLPLAVALEREGTAVWAAAAATFLAQAAGVTPGIRLGLLIVLTAALAAFATTGIPQAGIVTIFLVLNAAAIPSGGLALLLPVDWIVDRFRTAENVWGQAAAAAVVDAGGPDSLSP